MTEPRTYWACPFCSRELLDAQQPCCGEAGHAVEVEDEPDVNPEAPRELG
jgi:hypothetical protein